MRDLDVRTALRREIAQQHAGDCGTLVVEEMGIWSGSVRVDVAVLNGELHGFEIKSARDTLARLPTQQHLYSQVFDRVTLVVAEKHAAKAEQIIPDWWGTMLAQVHSDGDCAVSLSLGREGAQNPSPDPMQTVRLLWRQELLDILARHSLDKGMRSASADQLGRAVVANLAHPLLRNEVRASLKRRTSWSGKRVGDETKVPICVDFDPLRAATRTDGRIARD